ncbi:MAG: autotransporter-associated beta strand repeat-containing protein [Kiritimatiellia bacterium]
MAVANASSVSRVFTVAGTAATRYHRQVRGRRHHHRQRHDQGRRGTMILAGNNTYAGPTTVNDGLLISQNGTGIPDLSTVVMANSATAALQITQSEQVGLLSGGKGLEAATSPSPPAAPPSAPVKTAARPPMTASSPGRTSPCANAAAAPRPSPATTPSPAGWRSSAAPSLCPPSPPPASPSRSAWAPAPHPLLRRGRAVHHRRPRSYTPPTAT